MEGSVDVPPQDFAADQEMAAQRLNELMQEYMRIKEVQRDSVFANLHPDIRKRVYALKKLQVETIKLDADFHRAVYDLEEMFQGKHEEIFQKRSDIINSLYQPTDNECTLEGCEMKFDKPAEGQENAKGIPQFWLTVMKNVNELRKMIQLHDEDVLKHLTDIRACSKPSPDLSFQLDFHFKPNEYFQNTVLTKTYLMKCCLDSDDPFSFEGPEIYKSNGCEIIWNADKDVTLKGHKNPATPFYRGESFFNFFNPPELKAVESEENDKVEVYLEHDFEVGHYMKERVIPRAVLFFTGDIDEGMSDDDESIDYHDDEDEHEITEE